MVISLRLVMSAKAASPIAVTDSGIVLLKQPAINSFVAVFITALQLSRESYTGFAASTVIDLKALPGNAPLLIYVMELGNFKSKLLLIIE